MKSFKEMRREAWGIATTRWTLRMVVVVVSLGAFIVAARVLLNDFYSAHGIQNWGAFLESQLKMKASGLDISVASSRQFWSMTWASGLQTFVEYLGQSLCSFGVASLLLKAVRKDPDGWFGSAFAGFRMPLEVLWLSVLMSVRILLWSLLFIIPGIIAMYRYAMAWYVKAEHPDYSAWKCLDESGRLMKGYKFDFFFFILSYIGWLLLAGFALTAGIVAVGAAPVVGAPLLLAGIALLAFVVAYVGFGKVTFYTELKRISQNNSDNSQRSLNHE